MNNSLERFSFKNNLLNFDNTIWRIDYTKKYYDLIDLIEENPDSLNNLSTERSDELSRKIYAYTIEMFSLKQKIKSLFKEVKETININIKCNAYFKELANKTLGKSSNENEATYV